MAEKRDVRRATRIEGMRVWVKERDEDVGRVKGLVFDATGSRLVGVWVRPWDVMRRRRGLLLADVAHFGKSQLKVQSTKALMGATRFGRLSDKSGRFVELIGLPARDVGGESLGSVCDATLAAGAWTVLTLEVSQGLMADITSRPMRFRSSALVEIGPDGVILKADKALPAPKKPRSQMAKRAEEVAGLAGRAAGKGYVKAVTAWRGWAGVGSTKKAGAAKSSGQGGKARRGVGK